MSQPAAAPSTPSKTLTRPRAAELIKSHPDLTQSVTEVDLPTGSFWYDWRSINDIRQTNIQPLVEAGLITFRETGKSDSVWWHEYVVEFTSDGEEAAKSWRKGTEREWVLTYQGPIGIPSPNVVLYHVPVAVRQFIEVTGIAFDPNGMSARVEFTWKWVPTPSAKYLPSKVPSDEPRAAMVGMQLYDDGWRMGRIYP